MTEGALTRPRAFLDADVLFGGAAGPSEHGACLVILRMAEITLIDAVTSQQAIEGVERNLKAKLPETLPTFRLLVDRCLKVVVGPSQEELADPEDPGILVAAVREACPWLVTFNVRRYQPGHPSVTVLRPGDFVLRVRDRLTRFPSPDKEPDPSEREQAHGSVARQARARSTSHATLPGAARSASQAKGVNMEMKVSHDRAEETLEAKARWFRSLPLSDRMELLCVFTDLILENNPDIMEKRDAQSRAGRVRVLRKP